MEDFSALVRKSKKFKGDKEARYTESSKERLSKISKKKIQTTMIGALSSIEAHFGFLWGQDESDELSPEQEHMKEIYDQVRSEILDRGNNQVRNLEAELNQYDIKWNRYHLQIPIVSQTDTQEGGKDA
jgi:hypothetical protein|tara:strand:+ start:109 stop:492 length:384 start_codon:yes stop_codon:yes gene_type:complete